MSNEHCLMLQANIICLLLFIVGTAAMIQQPDSGRAILQEFCSYLN